MVVTNFKEARRENAEIGPFLNSDHFADEVEFTPHAGGGTRTITVAIEYDQEVGNEEFVEKDQERIWVKCLKEESAAKGGIGRPQLGDTLKRQNDRYPAPFSYQGEVRDETPHSWVLLFARNRPGRYGP